MFVNDHFIFMFYSASIRVQWYKIAMKLNQIWIEFDWLSFHRVSWPSSYWNEYMKVDGQSYQILPGINGFREWNGMQYDDLIMILTQNN